MRTALTAFLVLLCSTGAWSLCATPTRAADGAAGEAAGERSDPAVRALRGEWHRVGAGFACQVVAPQRLPPEAIKSEAMARTCLHMGPLVIGGEARTLDSVAAAPHDTLPQPKGATALVYFLDGPGRYPYLIATVLQDRIVALQVTGPAPSKGFGFNHVDLGAGTETLIQYFGQPSHLEPSGEKDTEVWSYGPWPFSFEVKDGHVTSVRIVDPAYF